MDFQNGKLYMMISVSIAFFLIGTSVILNFFPNNWVAILTMILICAGLSLGGSLYISEIIDPIEFNRKADIIAICISIIFLLFTIVLLLLYFPGDLIAYLLGMSTWIFISLPIIYVSIRSLSPLEATSKAEIFLTIVVALVGITFMVVFFINNLIALLLASAICLVLYLVIFLIIQFWRTR